MHRETVDESSKLKKVCEELLKAFTALNESYNAYEEKNWELFKEKYKIFIRSLEDVAERSWDSIFANALVAEALRGEFIRKLDLPSDVWGWLSNEGLVRMYDEIGEYYIDAYASLIDRISKASFQHPSPYLVWAIEWLKILRPMDPRTWINAWIARSGVYQRLMMDKEQGKGVDEKRLKELREELKGYLLKASFLDPNDYMVKRQLASLYHEDGDYENAIKYYRSCFNSSGSSTTAMSLCSIYESEGRLEEAIEVMEKRLEVDPKDIYAYARLIKLYVKAGNIDKAKELIEEFSKKQSELDLRTYARLTFYHKALAECYEMLGDLDKALDHLKRLENTIRKHIQEYNRRSRYLHSLNEWLEVVKKIDELSRKVTSNNDNSERFD